MRASKSLIVLILSFAFLIKGSAQFSGADLYASVKKYVSFGVHRTGTPGDSATGEWLSATLHSYGFDVHFQPFSFHQFFPSAVYVGKGADTVSAFPLWPVNETVQKASGTLVYSAAAHVSGSIVIIRLPLIKGGAGSTEKYIDSLAAQGAVGVVAITDNPSARVQAYNTAWNAKPLPFPVVLVAPNDSARIQELVDRHEPVDISIGGAFRNVVARNVYGKIGSGSEYIVVSTPISGWFTCGGERGTGLAIWLSLAKWASQLHSSRYTFVFTANSGHELAFKGAHEFLQTIAPPPDKTHLWVHLGAGAATLKYIGASGHLVAQTTADEKRRFFYSSGTAGTFPAVFDRLPGEKQLQDDNPGGELIYVSRAGYKRYVGITYAHPFFHVPGDDATTTSPQILESTAKAFRDYLELETKQ